MKTRYKRILGLFVLTFIILFGSAISVFAESCADKMKKHSNEPEYWANRYGITIDYDENKQQYKVSMSKSLKSGVSISKIKIKEFKTFNTKDEEAEKESDKFDYTGSVSYTKDEDIKKYIKSGSQILEPGSTIYIDPNVISGERTGLQVILVPESIKDTEWDDCNVYGELAINLYIELGVFDKGGEIKGELSDLISSYSSIDHIDCTNYKSFDHNGFDYKFCYAKAEAKEANRSYDFGKVDNGNDIGLSYEKKWGKNDPFKFKCSYKSLVDSQDNDVLNDENQYYTGDNKQYIYGKAEFEISQGTYKYHYEKYMSEHNNQPKTEDAKCTITCEESVVVEYGPPVASKAGLCFQYKVRVTSRVSCQQKEGGIKKPNSVKWCTPSPLCIGHGYTTRQGGPNEEFDACVNACDKGKYTDKCVNKCYKKVYGKKSKKTDTTLALYEARKLSDSDKNGIMDAPKYEYDSNGKIKWNTGSAGTTRTVGAWSSTIKNYTSSTDSKWHKTYVWGCGTKANYTVYTSNGIPKKPNCTDTCSWIGYGCSGDTYLNEEQAQMDYDANMEVYDQLVESCKAAASCNSTTAEFTMSVDYQKKGSTEVKEINFPYTGPNDKNKDELTSLGAKENIKNTSKANNSTIINYDGCYKDEGEKRWYQTEWTFPGTWINDKTGKISYIPENTRGVSSYPNKFCIPQNQKDVNTKWWLYYYAKKHGSDSSYAANNERHISGIEDCKSGSSGNSVSNKSTNSCDYGEATFTSEDAKDITYNIHASTKKFGYFGWYINVDCFYALYDAFDCSNNANNAQGSNYSKIKSNKTCKGDSEYRVRAVDLKNLFPSEDGSKLTSSDTTGRSPGYNWSEFATQSSKDTDYKSFPKKYTKWIQSKGYNVYSDQYLDYYIPLTKEEINKIKKTGKNYTDYKGKVDVNSVTNYKSDLIRNEIKGAKYPNGQALKCNNMKNYSSSECENVEEAN